jgi:small GTP-binding protein
MTENFNFENAVNNALREALKERGHVNILIAGRTGVGKSTLINAIFQGNFTITGQGRPVTQNTREIKKEGVPLSIFDTRGLEMADFSKTKDELRSFVSERRKETDPQKHIHVAWICISEDLRRVEPAEEELVKMLDEYMPVIVVITKSRSDQGFRSKVQEILPLAKNVIRVRAIEEELDDGYILKNMNLPELVDLTIQVIPEGLRRAFVAAQKVDIELKKSQSRIIVALAATSAAGIGATPIPFSDAVGIVPIQIGMIAGISATFGLSFNESFLYSIVGSIVTGAGGTIAGRAIVSGLLKFIPGIGSAAGGTIAATTAAALTTGFGTTYITVLEKLFIRNNGEPATQEEVVTAFKKQYLLPPR